VPRDLVFLIFGYPWILKAVISEERLLIKELENIRLSRLLTDSKVDLVFHKTLSDRQFISSLSSWEREFLVDFWPQERGKYEREYISDRDNYLKKMVQAQNISMIQFIEKTEITKFKEKLLSFLRATNVLLAKEHELRQEISNKTKELEITIPKEHPYRSKFPQWTKERINSILGKFIAKLRERLNNEILTELAKYPEEKYLFERYLEFLKDLPKFKSHDRKTSIKGEKAPEFHKTFFIKLENLQFSTQENFKYIELKPDRFGWKFSLLCLRINSNTRHYFNYFFTSAYYGLFGLKRICSCEPYPSPEADGPRSPVWAEFRKVLTSIELDRTRFEASRDDGFLPKSCSRLANLFFNYIIKLILIGIFYVLVVQSGKLNKICYKIDKKIFWLIF
jgi:hypothetical protein